MEPSPRALGESLAALAAQLADLRSEIRAINTQLDQAGLRADLNLPARFEDLAQTVAEALDAAAPRGPAAPYWIGLDRDTNAVRLADLRRWADTVLRQHYGGYELRDCWPRHIHAVWELSTLAAEMRACTVPNPPSPMITSGCAALNRASRSSWSGSPRAPGSPRRASRMPKPLTCGPAMREGARWRSRSPRVLGACRLRPARHGV